MTTRSDVADRRAMSPTPRDTFERMRDALTFHDADCLHSRDVAFLVRFYVAAVRAGDVVLPPDVPLTDFYTLADLAAKDAPWHDRGEKEREDRFCASLVRGPVCSCATRAVGEACPVCHSLTR